MIRAAECCCGACELELSSEPAMHGVCSCNNCKKRTGSAFGISAYFKDEYFKVLKSSFKTYVIENENGRQVRYFCKYCGTTMYWQADIFKDLVGVAGGCIVGAALSAPSFSARTENKCSWLTFSADMEIKFPMDELAE